MNYWQFKFTDWDGWKTIQTDGTVRWTSYKTIDSEPNDIAINDIVFLFRGGSSLNKSLKGIYLIAKVIDVDFEDTYPVNLQIIKKLDNDIFKAELYGFEDVVKKINKLQMSAKYYKFLATDNPNKLYELINENTTVIEDLKNIENDDNLTNTEKENLVKCRIGQGDFRKKLINYWGGCSVTQCQDLAILIASHIKPWKTSTNKERLDFYNGFLLTPNLDKLFDKGYITFDNKGLIEISKILENPILLGVDSNLKINIKSEHLPYLEFHRSNIFKKV
jgi:hypothetical protein